MTEEPGDAQPTPRWVKVFGLVALVLLLLVAVVALTGRGGGHGPGPHTPSGESGGHTAPTGGHEPP